MLRPLVWQREVAPNVKLALDDSLSLVLEVQPWMSPDKHRFTISNGDALIEAVDDARIERAVREALS